MATKKIVYLDRHGEAEHNLKPPPELWTELNARLTSLGHQQAESLARRASEMPIDVLVSSTRIRAVQTAEHISRRINRPIIQEDLFVEIRPPSGFEGKVWLDPEVQRMHDAWGATKYTHERVLDGENFPDTLQRGYSALQYLENRPEEHIMVVTHGLFKRIMVAIVLLGDVVSAAAVRRMEYSLRTVNTGITILEYDPGDQYSKWSLITWNNHSHL